MVTIQSGTPATIDTGLLGLLTGADKPYLRVVEESQGLSESEHYRDNAPPCSKIIVLGMGGSILGTRAISAFTGHLDRFIFLDNLDSDLYRKAANAIRHEDCCIIAISKSGGTVETLSMVDYLYPILKERYGQDASGRIAAITAVPDGKLGRWAREENIETLSMPLDLSGRFSVFSSVGTLPLTLAGVSVPEIHRGALRAFQDLETGDGQTGFFTILDTLLGSPDAPLVMFTYGNYLKLTAEWFRQIWAESLGKDGKFAQFPCTAAGTSDQHSVLQMILDVPRSTTTWVWYGEEPGSPLLGNSSFDLPPLKVSDYLEAAARGLYRALEERQVNRLWTCIHQRNEETIGYVLMTLMLVTHAASMRLEVSTFDQPAVELAKNFTREYIRDKAGGA